MTALATMNDDDDPTRRASLVELRRLHREYADEIKMFGYHDFGEMTQRAVHAASAQ